MEHRHSQRVEGTLPILLFKRGLPVATGEVKDASRRGLFIATDYDDIRLNQTIEVAFRTDGRGDAAHRRLSAQVIRLDDQGVGVDIDGLENDGVVIAELMDGVRQGHLDEVIRWFSEQPAN